MTNAEAKRLESEARSLNASGRNLEALALYRQIVSLAPNDPAAEHNLASALAAAGQWREGETHIRRAFAKGIDAPQSWLLLARCQQTLGFHDDAERAFLEALKRKPNLYDAHRELAQLRWMREADAAEALALMDAAIQRNPGDLRLQVLKAQALDNMGQADVAVELTRSLAAAHPHDPLVVTAAAQLAASAGDANEAVSLAERAALLAPGGYIQESTLVTACLAAGQAERASKLAAALRQRAPLDQHAIAMQATAWRLLGDARYRTLYDYQAFVVTDRLDTPAGWNSLASYLDDLATGLASEHRLRTHPFDQSIRHGSQIHDVPNIDHPAVRALPEALNGAIMRYLNRLGRGGDPLRSRNTGKYAVHGMWSIRMSAGGHHVDHIHPDGWISSACYVEMPKVRGEKEGWIKFGCPGVRTKPELDAEHFIEPQPGMLALFPSHMWHGTTRFSDKTPRMTVAFDIIPGPA
ncbi:MAG: putative 2OG-Fe(II) oxygenase [Hyphomonadaceae bacterium]